MTFRVTHLNPEGMPASPAYSQGVAVAGPARTIYVGGQNAVAADGSVVGIGDLGAQSEQVIANVARVLAAAGATLHDVVRWTIYVVQGQDDLRPGLAAFQRAWGDHPNPPAISAITVVGLARPEFLVEIEAVAVVEGGAVEGES